MTPTQPQDENSPRIWLLLGRRAGEVAQLRTLAAGLNLPFVEKRLGIDPLAPPWPDLAMAFGKDLRTLGRIRRGSGGHTRIVQLARSRGVPPAQIDLLIAMPQDQVPAAPNVLHLKMSLNRRSKAELDKAAGRAAPDLAALPKPWTALIVGGKDRHCRFEAADAVALGTQASRHARARGGSLLIVTSPRTGRPAAAALRGAIDVPCAFYDFRANDPANPMAAYLALADDLIVTGDSSSMLAEAWRTGKPVHVFPLPQGRSALREWIRTLGRRLPQPIYDALLARGLISAPVDLALWIRERVAAGDFAPLGSPPPRRRYDPARDDDLERCLARIRELLSSTPS